VLQGVWVDHDDPPAGPGRDGDDPPFPVPDADDGGDASVTLSGLSGPAPPACSVRP
jgi:hypothetical protein